MAERKHPADLQVAAAKRAKAVLGAADNLLVATRAILAERERELLVLAGPCHLISEVDCGLHLNHSGPCDIGSAARGW